MPFHKVAVIFDNKVRPDTTGVYCRRALGQLVEVEHFLPDELARIPCKEFDLYLNIDDGLEYRLPADLRPCAWWAIDTHLNLPWYLTKAQDFDQVFTAQRDGAERLRQSGVLSAIWLPLACDPDLHCKHDSEKTFDLCFIGHLFPGPRSDLLTLLQQHFPNIFVGQRFFSEMAQTYSAARIVFNRSIRNDINMRVFEALACGSLLLTNDLRENGQDELFRDGLHLATYRDPDELLDKVKFYLRHDAERERIAAAGRMEVLAHHTYRHRMIMLLEEVERALVCPSVVFNSVESACSEGVNPDFVEQLNEAKSAVIPASESPLDHDFLGYRQAHLLRLLPECAYRVLVIGRRISCFVEALKARGSAEVVTVDLETLTTCRPLEQLVVEEIEQGDAGYSPHSFAAIVFAELLDRVTGPTRLLRRAVNWLEPQGVLIVTFPNARHYQLQRSLLEGDWPPDALAFPDGENVRFFSRRQIEKLCFRAGLTIDCMQPLDGPGHDEWKQQGRPGTVLIGRYQINGLSALEAEDYYASHYAVRARPAVTEEYGLTSIVLLTHNELSYTRLCVDSIRRSTDEPYELIFVDNASTDGTADYLRTLGNVKLIVNAENRGFPAAVNQGIQLAAGQQILLLNNDTVVTTGWLRRLLRAIHSDPKVALVGPCSNRVSGEQQVPVSYEDLSGLDGFAWDWGKANSGSWVDTDRLVGFCLLCRRDVVDRIGPLDERFGVGCFEDDDYCLRVRQAGYRVVIARDAFVHHFGSRTFVGSGVDFAALMQHNHALFRDKWKKTDALVVAPPTPTVAQSATAEKGYCLRIAPGGGLLLVKGSLALSLCMIVRDNARTIEPCLKSIAPWVDEMIVVDTGSKDETPQLAARLGARVFHYPWCDSFAAARNESLRHARGRWIFWMDSDDTIDAANGRKLRELALCDAPPPLLGYIMQVHCPGAGAEGEADVTVVDHVKLFRNLPELRFERRIHEQIIPAIRRAGGDLAWSDVFVVHSGYDHTPDGQERKKRRDLHLLNLELREEPDHPFTLFNLGMTYGNIGDHAEAVRFLRRCLDHSGEGESHLRKAHALLAHSLQQLGRHDEAWAACEGALRLFSQDAELLFRRAGLLHERGQLAEAAEAYEHLLRSTDERHFSSAVRGLQGFLARHNLALVYTDLGDLPQAEKQWRLVTEEAPRYRAGWRGLGDNLLRQGKHQEVLAVAERLAADPNLEHEGLILKGHAAIARGDAGAAGHLLQQAVAARNDDCYGLEALCRFLFEQNRMADAENPLRRLVTLEPQNAAAYHNLGTVYLRTGRPREAVAAYRLSLCHRPDSKASHLNLGYALRDCGQLEEAVAAWEEVLRLAPGHSEAAELLRQVRRPGEDQTQAHATAGSRREPFLFRLGKRQVEIPLTIRGPTDRSIIQEVWERDAYGVGHLSEIPATVVDIGAHIGVFALLATEMWPGARVIACEADPENYTLLRANLDGRRNVETVQAAVVGEEVSEVEFSAVSDKRMHNSGGGSCVRSEPWSVKIRVPAISAVVLWRTKGVSRCDLLKLDCEGAEVSILRALACAGLLDAVRMIVGEWHAEDGQVRMKEQVKGALRATLQGTHDLTFAADRGGREGHFTARLHKQP